jgi:putative hydrolase of the HAD superfamily
VERTVVFDLGEVLVSSAAVLPQLATELDVTEEALAAAYWPPRLPYDLGKPSDAYWSAVAMALGRDPEPALLQRMEDLDSTKWSGLPTHSAALVGHLAGDGVRLAVLSNAPAPLAAAVRAAPWSSAFAHLVFSADVGLMKPDPAIFAHADAVYGTQPHQVVFFDDRVDNVAGARAHGWDAHVWVDPATALEMLG